MSFYLSYIVYHIHDINMYNFDTFKSSPPSVTYMRQWTGTPLVKIMACRLFGAKPLSKPMQGYCQLDHEEQISVKFQSKYKFFIHENAYENIICEMAAILSRGRWVNPT